MLPRHFSFLLLLFGLSNGFDYKIETDRCKEDTACFVRGSCFGAGKATELIQYKADDTNKLNQDCDVILQIKAFTDKKFHVMMQVKSAVEPIVNGAIRLEQGSSNELVFGCEKDKDPSASADFTIKALGKQIHEDKKAFCSFTVEAITDTIPDKFKTNTAKPAVVFKTNVDQAVEYNGPQKKLYYVTAGTASCNPDNINSPGGGDDVFLLSPLETTHLQLSCATGTLRIVENGKDIRPPTMQCVGKEWEYSLDGGATLGNIDNITPFEAHCETKYCTQCKTYEPDAACTDCSPVTLKPRPQDQCLIMECPGNKWRKEGLVVDGTLECKKDPDNAGTSAWFLGTDKAGVMGCSDKVDCKAFSKLVLDGVSYDEPGLSCTDNSLVIRVSDNLAVPRLECDEKTGQYTAQGTLVAPGSTLACEQVVKPVEKKEEAAQSGQGATFIALGITVAVLVLAGAAAAFLIVRKKRRAAAERPKSIKKNLTREAIKSKEAPSSSGAAPASAPASAGAAPSSNESK